jgi:hypothetical protein
MIDEHIEPPLTYYLDVNGRVEPLRLDEPVTLYGGYDNPTVVLRASATRHFAYGDIEFEYPGWFTWEADITSPKEKTWVLSGNDFKIMYFLLPGNMSVADFAKILVKQFGGMKHARVGGAERILGGSKREGRRLRVKLAGSSINLEVFALPSDAGSARLLVLQDAPGDADVSEEGTQTYSLLAGSFKDARARAT